MSHECFGDESTALPYVTAAVVVLSEAQVLRASSALATIKQNVGVSHNAKIHCRELFAGHARLKGPFRKLSTTDVQRLLHDCVVTTTTVGARFSLASVDMSRYPTKLRLLDGEEFAVGSKHVAGFLMTTALMNAADAFGANENAFFYDQDSTKIDWGLAARMRADHFSRAHPQALNSALTPERRALLDVADIAAYSFGRVLSGAETGRRGTGYFRELVDFMNASKVKLTWEPPPLDTEER